MGTASQPLPSDIVSMDFEIQKEGWNTYELKDGTILKGRMIVTRINTTKNGPPGQMALSSQNIFAAFAPEGVKGPPMNPPPVDQIKNEDKYPVEITSSNELWNEYRILKTGDTLRVKMVVSDVFRVKDKFDRLGEPYFIVNSGIIISPGKKTISS